jgi:hypothetical protein
VSSSTNADDGRRRDGTVAEDASRDASMGRVLGLDGPQVEEVTAALGGEKFEAGLLDRLL